MGNLISSPYQRASEDLYSKAMSGQPVGANFLDAQTTSEISALRNNTASRISGIAGDELSRAASMGFAPGSGMEGVIGKSVQPIISNETSAEEQLDASKNSQLMQMLLSQLTAGLGGLSHSSTVGDVMGGLTSLANLGQGIAKMGAGFGWWTPASSGGSGSGN